MTLEGGNEMRTIVYRNGKYEPMNQELKPCKCSNKGKRIPILTDGVAEREKCGAQAQIDAWNRIKEDRQDAELQALTKAGVAVVHEASKTVLVSPALIEAIKRLKELV